MGSAPDAEAALEALRKEHEQLKKDYAAMYADRGALSSELKKIRDLLRGSRKDLEVTEEHRALAREFLGHPHPNTDHYERLSRLVAVAAHHERDQILMRIIATVVQEPWEGS